MMGTVRCKDIVATDDYWKFYFADERSVCDSWPSW